MPRNVTRDSLTARLKARRGKGRTTWYLDLRHEDFAGIGRMTLRDPSHADWPAKGRTARTKAEAELWIEARYVDHVRREVRAARTSPDARKTVAEACDSFVADLEAQLGPDHNTVGNWRSVCEVHLKPAFGLLPMTALTPARVRPFLNGLKVAKRRRGKTWESPARYHTKTNVRAVLRAVCRHVDPDFPLLTAELRIEQDSRSRELREAAASGRIMGDVVAYSRADVARILGFAADYDRRSITAKPNVAARVIPNTAAAIALQVGLGVRIEELMHLRWSHVFLDEGLVYVPGTKSQWAVRWTPIQLSLLPWIHHLRELQGAPRPEDFLFRVDPRRGGEYRTPSKKTYGGRIARVLKRAGLKVEQKATHIFRATHITWAQGGYPLGRLQRWVGHSGSQTITETVYTDPRLMAAELIPADRTYLGDLPTPEDAASLAVRIARGKIQ